MLKYLKDYADHFDLKPLVHVITNIVSNGTHTPPPVGDVHTVSIRVTCATQNWISGKGWREGQAVVYKMSRNELGNIMSDSGLTIS